MKRLVVLGHLSMSIVLPLKVHAADALNYVYGNCAEKAENGSCARYFIYKTSGSSSEFSYGECKAVGGDFGDFGGCTIPEVSVLTPPISSPLPASPSRCQQEAEATQQKCQSAQAYLNQARSSLDQLSYQIQSTPTTSPEQACQVLNDSARLARNQLSSWQSACGIQVDRCIQYCRQETQNQQEARSYESACRSYLSQKSQVDQDLAVATNSIRSAEACVQREQQNTQQARRPDDQVPGTYRPTDPYQAYPSAQPSSQPFAPTPFYPQANSGWNQTMDPNTFNAPSGCQDRAYAAMNIECICAANPKDIRCGETQTDLASNVGKDRYEPASQQYEPSEAPPAGPDGEHFPGQDGTPGVARYSPPLQSGQPIAPYVGSSDTNFASTGSTQSQAATSTRKGYKKTKAGNEVHSGHYLGQAVGWKPKSARDLFADGPSNSGIKNSIPRLPILRKRFVEVGQKIMATGSAWFKAFRFPWEKEKGISLRPRRSLASASARTVGIDGITGPHTDLFLKVRQRFYLVADTLIK